MGFVLDSIVKETVFEGPSTINADTTFDAIDVSGVESEFAIQMKWINGSTVDMDVVLEASIDGVTYVPIPETSFNLTTDDDVALWDVNGRGFNFIRVDLTVTTGNFDLEYIEFSGVRRH